MTKRIKVTEPHSYDLYHWALVDDEDYLLLSRHQWRLNKGYAHSGHEYLMHRLILPPPQGLEVDHINGNKLDNRKANLRIVNRSLNMLNIDQSCRTVSGYRGVQWNKDRGRWRARIKIDYKEIHLGYFDKLEDAVRARRRAVQKAFDGNRG